MGSRGYGSVKEAPTELGFGPGKRAPITAADYQELERQKSAAPNLSYMDQFRTAVGIPVGGTVAGGTPAATAVTAAKPAGQAAQKKPATNPKKVLAKSDPAVLARQQELIAAGAKIKADGVMGKNTRDAEKQFGPAIDAAKPTNNASSSMTGDTAQATDRFAGQAKTDAQTGQNNLGVAGANPAANPGSAAAGSAFSQDKMGTRADPAADPGSAAAGSAFNQGNMGTKADPAADPTQPANPMAGKAPSAELDRIKQLAIGNQPGGAAPAPSGQAAQQEPTAPVAAPARGNPMQPNIIEPQDAAMPLPANIGSMNPTDAARELRAAQAQAGKPVLEPGAQVVGTGTGGSMKTGTGGLLTTRSPDQIEWENRPENKYGNKPYPGAAAVAQQDAARKASGDKNLSKVKNFFGFGDKSKAADPAAADPTAPINPNSGVKSNMAQTAMRESDDALLATIRNIR